MGIIALDLDEVVFNFIDPFLALANKKYKTNYTRNNLNTYSFEDSGLIPKGTNQALLNEFGDMGGIRNLELMPAAGIFIKLLKQDGNEIIYITSRDGRYKEDTEHSLMINDIAGDVYYSTPSLPKSYFVNKYGANEFVDDNPIFIKDVAHNTACNTILFSQIPGSIKLASGFYKNLTKSWDELYHIIR